MDDLQEEHSAEFHPDPIWNYGALGFFRRGRSNS